MLLSQQDNFQIFIRAKPDGKNENPSIFAPSPSQDDVFKMIGLPLINNALQGYSGFIFTYGSTGSGKTYTLIGNNDGLLPQSLNYLFTQTQNNNVSIKLSVLQISKEGIQNLLQLHDQIGNIKSVQITNYKEAINLLGNLDMSKNHTVYILQYLSSKQEGQYEIHTLSKIYFIELANNYFEDNIETIFGALIEKSNMNHTQIPLEYQNLINLLNDSQIGIQKRIMIFTINPINEKESHEVLQLAEKMKQLKESQPPLEQQKQDMDHKKQDQDKQNEMLKEFQQQFDKITALFQKIQESQFDLELQQREQLQKEFSENITEIMKTFDLKFSGKDNLSSQQNQQKQLGKQNIEIENEYLTLYEENESQKQVLEDLQRKLSQMQQSFILLQDSNPFISRQNYNYRLQQELLEQKQQNELLRIKTELREQVQGQASQIRRLKEQNNTLKSENDKLKQIKNQKKQLKLMRKNLESLEKKCQELQVQLQNTVDIPTQEESYQNIIDDNVIMQLQQLEDTFFNKKGCRQVELTTNIFGELIKKLNNLNTHEQKQKQQQNDMRRNDVIVQKEKEIEDLKGKIQQQNFQYNTKIALTNGKIRNIKRDFRLLKKQKGQVSQELSESHDLLQYIEKKLQDYVSLAFNNTKRIMTLEQQELYIKATKRDQSKFIRIESLLDFIIWDTIIYQQRSKMILS